MPGTAPCRGSRRAGTWWLSLVGWCGINRKGDCARWLSMWKREPHPGNRLMDGNLQQEAAVVRSLSSPVESFEITWIQGLPRVSALLWSWTETLRETGLTAKLPRTKQTGHQTTTPHHHHAPSQPQRLQPASIDITVSSRPAQDSTESTTTAS
jgi:hypothetical protein